MESKDLQRTENDENQNLNATAGVLSEDQPNANENNTANSNATPVETEQLPADEIVETLVQNNDAKEMPATAAADVVTSENTEIQKNDAPTPEKVEDTTPAANISAEDMMAEIEQGNAQQVEEEQQEDDDEDDDEDEEPIEKIEEEYSNLTFEDAVEELHRIVAEPNYNKVKQRVGVLRTKILQFIKDNRQEQLEAFIQGGGAKENFVQEPSPIEDKFHDALQIFRNNKNKFLENIELERQRNLDAKNAVIEELRVLIESETNLKVLNDKYKELQDKWKAIGPVPKNETNNLWNNFHFYVQKFFDIVHINKELRTLDLRKNLEMKIKLCEAAESLLLQDSVNKSFKELQELHNQWKEIGPAPEDKKDELWERFKTASDQINQRRREHYDQIYSEQQNSYNAKIVLCEQAEELITQPAENAKEYNAISDQLTELLKVWKTLGAAPPKVNEEIWTRFKSSLDKFFDKKKDFFQIIKDEQVQNYNLKLNLAIQAEAIAQRTDWRNATDDIIKLQKEWKNIGATSRKHSELVWKRFRGACDKFFEAKSHYFSNVQDIEADNLKQKEELIQRILDHQFIEDKNANMEAMKAFQREWTELGYVPKKDKDRIYAAYREALDKRFADIKVSMEDVKRDNFKTKIDTILNNPNADRILDKEKRFLVNKLAQLKDEISIWENNLGFFANSKNADLLKEEFSKKIDAAKAEVKDLEYKIKMMNKSK